MVEVRGDIILLVNHLGTNVKEEAPNVLIERNLMSMTEPNKAKTENLKFPTKTELMEDDDFDDIEYDDAGDYGIEIDYTTQS